MSKSEELLGVKYTELNPQQKKIYQNILKKESRKRNPESIKANNKKYYEKQKQIVTKLKQQLAEKDKLIEELQTKLKIVNNVNDSFLDIIQNRKDFNEVVNEALLQVKPIRLRKQIANDFFLLIAAKEQKTRHEICEEIREKFIKINTGAYGENTIEFNPIANAAYNECLHDLECFLNDEIEGGKK